MAFRARKVFGSFEKRTPGTQTAIDFLPVFNPLLSLTTVLSDTFSRGSCLKEHLTSKDSFTYWHPRSR